MRYVYILFRPDLTPFYVGKGQGKRWEEHVTQARRGRSYKDNVICQILDQGLEVIKIKVAEGLSNETACKLEVVLIAGIGRYPFGPLTNLTGGGEGLVNPSPELRERLSALKRGIIQPRELVERRSASNRGQKRSLEQREHISASKRSAVYSDEYRAKMVQNGKRVRSPAERAKLSYAIRRRLDEKTWGRASSAVLGELAMAT